MYRLYEFSSSGNCYKLRLAMAQLGAPFERVEKDITRGETRSDDFLAINPNGRIPVLVTPDGRTLPESNAALWYLARDSQLMPTDAFEQAQVLQWMFFEQYNHEPNIATSRYWLHVLGEPEKYAEGLKEKQQKGHEALAVMERHLQAVPFFVGGRYSIADIALYAYTHVANEGGFSLRAYPGVRAWLDAVRGQPDHVPLLG